MSKKIFGGKKKKAPVVEGPVVTPIDQEATKKRKAIGRRGLEETRLVGTILGGQSQKLGG